MWKLYTTGDPEKGYEHILRTETIQIPLVQDPWITDDWVKMVGIDNKIYMCGPEEIKIVRRTVDEVFYQFCKDYRTEKKPSDASVAVAALIADLNHYSDFYFFDHTPEGQRFAYETKQDMGSRKLKKDRDNT
jgi:hypothetical protein